MSPELPSDREDSDNLVKGNANDELLSSPYAGGGGPPTDVEDNRGGSSKLTCGFLIPSSLKAWLMTSGDDLFRKGPNRCLSLGRLSEDRG